MPSFHFNAMYSILLKLMIIIWLITGSLYVSDNKGPQFFEFEEENGICNTFRYYGTNMVIGY